MELPAGRGTRAAISRAGPWCLPDSLAFDNQEVAMEEPKPPGGAGGQGRACQAVATHVPSPP